MRRLLLGFCLVLAWTLPAWAQDTHGFDDEAFVTQYFGSSLILLSPTQLPVGEYESWTEKLPEALSYDASYIAGLVNAQRMQKGVTPLINPSDSVVIPQWEPSEVEGGWQYQIDFLGLRPSEVELVLQTLGGLAKVVPGATGSYMPLLTASNYSSTMNWVDPFVVRLGSYEFSFPQDQSPTALLADVQAKLAEKFEGIMVDATVDYSISSSGDASAYLSIYANLPAG